LAVSSALEHQRDVIAHRQLDQPRQHRVVVQAQHNVSNSARCKRFQVPSARPSTWRPLVTPRSDEVDESRACHGSDHLGVAGGANAS